MVSFFRPTREGRLSKVSWAKVFAEGQSALLFLQIKSSVPPYSLNVFLLRPSSFFSCYFDVFLDKPAFLLRRSVCFCLRCLVTLCLVVPRTAWSFSGTWKLENARLLFRLTRVQSTRLLTTNINISSHQEGKPTHKKKFFVNAFSLLNPYLYLACGHSPPPLRGRGRLDTGYLIFWLLGNL